MTKRSGYGPQSIDSKLTTLLKPLFSGSKKEFLIINNLVKNWEEIVGKKYAKFCKPKEINFSKNPRETHRQAKLTIAVYNSSVGFMLENNTEFLLEKIATLYGFKAVHRIIIKQEPQPFENELLEEIKLPSAQEEKLQASIAGIEDKELARSLANLGRAVIKGNEPA